MRNASHQAMGETELAQLIAQDDVFSTFGPDEWDDAVAVADIDRALLCESLAAAADDDYE